MKAEVWPSEWKDLRVAALDVETTGFDPSVERIIEIGIVTFENGEIVESWGQLVNPGKPIPAEVQSLTGISDEDVADQPPFADVYQEVQNRLTDVGILAYNLAFDRKFITAELERVGGFWPTNAPTLDPLIFARQLQKEHSRFNLGVVAERLGISLENAHRATDDAMVAGQIMYAFAEELPARLQDLLVLQAQWEQLAEAEQAFWKRRRSDDDGPSSAALSASMLNASTVGLGPAYVYGEEMDPLRALYKSIPELRRT